MFQRFPLALILGLLLSQLAFAAPEKQLDPQWVGYDARSTEVINHQPWQQFLDKYLITDQTSQTFMTYAKVSDEDYQVLSDYTSTLVSIDPKTLNREEQKSYWINLYNALTVKLILENYPVKSITKIKKGLFSFGPWNDDIVKINGVDITLNDIEHRILRPIYNDPRIHYALNCASLGCPNLLSQVFTSGNTEQLLELAANNFINHERSVRIEDGKLVLSSIYKWYQIDFGGTEQSVLKHIKEYLDKNEASTLSKYIDDIKYEYDWALNEVIK